MIDFEYSTLLDYSCTGMLCVFGIFCMLYGIICLTCKKSLQEKRRERMHQAANSKLDS